MNIDTLTYIVFILLFIVFVLILAIAVSLMRCQRAVEEMKKNLIQTPSPAPEKKSTPKSILKKTTEKPVEKPTEKPAEKHVSFDPEPLVLEEKKPPTNAVNETKDENQEDTRDEGLL